MIRYDTMQLAVGLSVTFLFVVTFLNSQNRKCTFRIPKAKLFDIPDSKFEILINTTQPIEEEIERHKD